MAFSFYGSDKDWELCEKLRPFSQADRQAWLCGVVPASSNYGGGGGGGGELVDRTDEKKKRFFRQKEKKNNVAEKEN